jgi:hypothetical protein
MDGLDFSVNLSASRPSGLRAVANGDDRRQRGAIHVGAQRRLRVLALRVIPPMGFGWQHSPTLAPASPDATSDVVVLLLRGRGTARRARRQSGMARGTRGLRGVQRHHCDAPTARRASCRQCGGPSAPSLSRPQSIRSRRPPSARFLRRRSRDKGPTPPPRTTHTADLFRARARPCPHLHRSACSRLRRWCNFCGR